MTSWRFRLVNDDDDDDGDDDDDDGGDDDEVTRTPRRAKSGSP